MGSEMCIRDRAKLTATIRESQDELDELELRWLEASEALEA